MKPIHSSTPPLLHSSTPPLLHSSTPPLLWILLLFLALPASLRAEFIYSKVGGSITIFGGYSLPSNLVIPSTIDGLPVTRIDDYAFEGTVLQSVTIPDSVTSIGSTAFKDCPWLISITFGNGVTSIPSFAGLQKLRIVNIGNGVTSIGYGAFANCPRLASVTIGSGVTSIGNDAFNGCLALSNLELGRSVQSIGNQAFIDCRLQSLTIPNSVKSIGQGAFSNNRGLKTVTFPDSVISIGDYAFNQCVSLTNINFGNGLTSIGAGAFRDCTSLATITFGNALASLGDSAFGYNPQLISAYFLGDAPSIVNPNAPWMNLDPFSGSGSVSCYYVSTRTGWSSHLAGHPTYTWNPLFITSSASADVTLGQPFNYAITANNLPTQFAATDLPSGFSLDPLTGIISGISSTEGTYTVTVSASNSESTVSQSLTLTIKLLAPVLTVHAVATVGMPFNYSITANNSPASFTATGLPSGLSIDPATGVISGVPSSEGTYTVTLSASNSAGSDSQPLALTVNLPSKMNFDPSKNQVVLTMQGLGNKEHVVEYTDDLKQWIPLAAKFSGTKDLSDLDPQAATRPFRFYRVK